MHSFLRAIGFSDTFSSEHEVELLLDRFFQTYDNREAVRVDSDRAFLEISKEVGPDMGIRICGEMDQHGFHRLYYYPYLVGGGVTTQEDMSVDRKVNGEGYSVLVEEGRVGISLIFFLQNPAALKKESIAGKLVGNKITATFSGLSLSGTILLPSKKTSVDRALEHSAYYQRHSNLVSEARNGNPEAMETLTMEDMDNYAMVTRRLQTEDVFTIVESFFMPSGMECDQYQIMGTILFYRKVRNSISKEYVYQMTIDCNGMVFDICINEKDLFGDPEEGRRFKGTIWLQGKMNFNTLLQ